jgi:hypothetical protein
MYRWWTDDLKRKDYFYFSKVENPWIFHFYLFTVGFLHKTALSPLTGAAVSGINKNDKGE